MKLKQSVFIVTGGASGLGEAAVRRLAARGSRVIIADLNPSGEALAAELGQQARFQRTDVAQEADGTAAVQAALDTFGALHGLVNCAGVAPSERIVSRNGPHDLQNFVRTIAVNLTGTFNMLRLAAGAMQRNQPGSEGERGIIINTASIAAFEGQIGQAAYAASKAGVAGLTLPAARELARFGIRVVTIAPGLFLTPMVTAFSSQVQESLMQSAIFPARLGRPEEYAALVESICTLSMLNGETIRLDGAVRLAPK